MSSLSRPGLHPALEGRLGEVSRRWRFHRFLIALADLVTVVALALLVLGVVAARRWLTDGVTVVGVVLVLGLLATVAFIAIAVAVSVARRPRRALGQALEGVAPDLLDRVNTLVFLESRRDPELRGYFERVEQQAVRSVAGRALPSPFPAAARRRRWLIALAATFATVVWYSATEPWRALSFGARARAEAAEVEPGLKLPEPAAAEVESLWGEVRITEPGRDLKVTKVDVVPLQIEVAANATLARAGWTTSVGGGSRKENPLPAPREPHYAVYRPVLYVDELRLSDWDVVSYFASASTSAGRGYASEIYFLEVRPFREDILKMPGGEGGKGYQLLSELSGLIDRQKQILRETHGFLQRTYPDAAAKEQDRRKLALAEAELAKAARHLYGEIAAKMEHTDVAVVLDQLARGAELLESAARAVTGGEPRALPVEQEALAALVATRKTLQKVITDGGGGDKDGGDDDDEESPVADLPDRLKHIAEFRNEEKAVREALSRVEKEQKRIADEAARPGTERSALADAEDGLRKQLEELAQGHPRQFKRAQEHGKAAQEAMSEAARALRSAEGGGERETAQAREALGKLRETVARRSGGEQLGHAYALREALEGQARDMDRMAREPREGDGEGARRAAEASRGASRELKQLVDETGVGDAFAPALKEELGAARQADREQALEELARAPDGEERKAAARAAGESLRDLTGAFDRSAPTLVRKLRAEDALKEGESDAFARALRQLEGLAGDDGRPRAPTEDDRKQRRQALADLERGVRSRYGKDPKMARLLVEIEHALEGDKVDGPRVRKLLDQIERFRVERGESVAERKGRPDLRHTDPEKLPSTYRDRIERYFRKLSEQ